MSGACHGRCGRRVLKAFAILLPFQVAFGIPGCTQCFDATPLAVAETNIYDFGRTRQGDVRKHTFVLINRSRRSLRIEELASSCGCLTAGQELESESTTLEPGRSFKVPVYFKPSGSETSAKGLVKVFYEFLDVKKNAEAVERKFVALVVRASMIPEYRVVPRQIRLGEVRGLDGKEVKKLIKVVPESKSDLRVLKVKSLEEFFQVKLLPYDCKTGAQEIEVSVNVSNLSVGRPLNGSIVISTNSDRAPAFVVGVEGRYIAPFRVDPSVVLVNSTERGEVFRDVNIELSHDSVIKSVRSAHGVRIIREKRLAGNAFSLRASIPECSGLPLDSSISVEMELMKESGGTVTRTCTIPIYRFQKGKSGE